MFGLVYEVVCIDLLLLYGTVPTCFVLVYSCFRIIMYLHLRVIVYLRKLAVVHVRGM